MRIVSGEDHNEEIHSYYSYPRVSVIKIRWLRWKMYVIRMEEGMDALKISAGEPTDKESSRKV